MTSPVSGHAGGNFRLVGGLVQGCSVQQNRPAAAPGKPGAPNPVCPLMLAGMTGRPAGPTLASCAGIAVPEQTLVCTARRSGARMLGWAAGQSGSASSNMTAFLLLSQPPSPPRYVGEQLRYINADSHVHIRPVKVATGLFITPSSALAMSSDTTCSRESGARSLQN